MSALKQSKLEMFNSLTSQLKKMEPHMNNTNFKLTQNSFFTKELFHYSSAQQLELIKNNTNKDGVKVLSSQLEILHNSKMSKEYNKSIQMLTEYLKNVCIPNYKISHILPIITHQSEPDNYPYLLYTENLYLQIKDLYSNRLAALADTKFIGKIVGKYVVLFDTIYITFYFEFDNSFYNKTKTKLEILWVQSIKIDTYFYNEKDAIFWNWYGGNIPTSNNTELKLVSDTGINSFANGWATCDNYPIYSGITGIIYKKYNDIDSKIKEFQSTVLQSILESTLLVQ